MDSKNRILNRGGFMAALICLFVAACGPNGGTDSGVPPDSDGGMPLDDADVPPPDSGMPPDDGGMDPDTGMGDCTDEMMRDRVTPPCDPDTRTGAGTGPTGLEGFVGGANEWFSTSGGCPAGMETDSMGRIGLGMECVETSGIVFYYDRDGLWYYNWQNRATQEHARVSFDPETGHDVATIELFHAGEDVPYQTVMAYR